MPLKEAQREELVKTLEKHILGGDTDSIFISASEIRNFQGCEVKTMYKFHNPRLKRAEELSNKLKNANSWEEFSRIRLVNLNDMVLISSQELTNIKYILQRKLNGFCGHCGCVLHKNLDQYPKHYRLCCGCYEFLEFSIHLYFNWDLLKSLRTHSGMVLWKGMFIPIEEIDTMVKKYTVKIDG